MNQDAGSRTWWAHRHDRRTILRGSLLGAGGLATAALMGCGSDDDEEPTTASTTSPEGNSGETGVTLRTTDPRPDTLPEGWVWDEGLPFPYQYPEPDKEPKSGGTLHVATTWDVGPMDPTVSSAGGSNVVPNNVYNRLIGYRGGVDVDPFGLELVPELAKDWERSPDGLTVTFHLQEGVKWQNLPPLNGRDFTAEDAKYTYERYASEGLHQSYWVEAESIEAIDPVTLQVKLARPLVDFIVPLGNRYQSIFPRETVEDGSIATTVIGTGPMILREAVAASHVLLDKNPDFWRRDVLLDGVDFRVMPDPASRVAAFRSGQVEYAYSAVSSLNDVQNLLGTNPDVQVNITPTTAATGISPMFQLQNPKYQDERVRRAVSLAIDRETIIQITGGGLGKVVPVMPWIYVMDEEPTIENGGFGEWVRHAPDESRALLQAAGAEGLIIDAPYFEYSAAVTQTAEIMVDQFRQVGIEYKAYKTDYTQFNSQLHTGQFVDAVAYGYLVLGFDADTYFYHQIHSTSAGNRDHINDAEIDEWAEAQRIESDPDARRELHRKIWDKSLDQVYRPVGTAILRYEVLQPWVRGLRFGGALGNNSSYYEWGMQIENVWLDR